MVVSGQLHIPDALSRGKIPRYSLDGRLGGFQSWSSHILIGWEVGWVPELVFTHTPLINIINTPNIGFSSTKSHPV
jgi:hypothetical protein